MVKIDTGDVIPLKTPMGMYSNLNISPSSTTLLCDYSNYKTNSQILEINLEKSLKQEDCFTVRLNSGIRVEYYDNLFTKPEVVSFPTSDGLMAHGLLYLKSDNEQQKKNAPVIIMVHGGPTGMSTNSWRGMNQYYVSRGWAVFQINHRGSIGYGRDYREKLNGNWGVYDVDDSVDALNFLSAKGFVNKNKSVILGGSAGGFTVLMTMARKPGEFTAGVDLFGVADNFLLAEETHYLESRYTDSLVGPLPEAAAKYFSQSPLYIAENIVDPLLILQGEDDQVVPKNQSEMIKEKVKGYVEMKIYPGEGHGFRKAKTVKDMYSRIDRFLKKYVLYRSN